MNGIACIDIKGAQEFTIFTEKIKRRVSRLTCSKKQRKFVNLPKVEFMSDNIGFQKLFGRLLKMKTDLGEEVLSLLEIDTGEFEILLRLCKPFANNLKVNHRGLCLL